MTQFILELATCPRTGEWNYTINDNWLAPMQPASWTTAFDLDEDGDGKKIWNYERMVFASPLKRAKFIENYRLRHGEPCE